MNLFEEWMGYLDQSVLLFSTPLILCYFVFGLDDFFIDLMAWIKGSRPTEVSRRELNRILSARQKRIGILVASWKESGVLRKMVSGNTNGIEYQNYEFILGVYPNDPATLAEAEELARRYLNVQVVINSRQGPTSKGQMLNEMVRAAVGLGKTRGLPYDGFLIHDSEDIIHPYSLSLISAGLTHYDFIQIPIFSLPVEKSEFVAGTYIDEFSEHHTKDILLRHQLGAAIPSAGVGTAISSRLVDTYMNAQGGDLLNERSLTEDYELGLSTSRYGMRSTFLCHYVVNDDGSRDFIATREYFPKSFTRSIKQKTRWTVGIAFQGSEHLGWRGKLVEKYFLYRDRKGPLASILVAAGITSFVYCAMRSVQTTSLFDSLMGSEIVYFGFSINAFFMINRILQRMYCVSGIYGFKMAAVGIVRLPIANLINAVAAFRAIQQYSGSKVFGHALQWQKTEHELPADFGMDKSA